jgi:probable rRNA maturation factor
MEPPSTPTVTIHNPNGIPEEYCSRLQEAILATFERHMDKLPRIGVVEVSLIKDSAISELNNAFRNKPSATDVLTFPAPDFPGAPIGEIAISTETAQRQADIRGIPLEQEICFLGIHGALHLVGYDDIEENDREEMLLEMNRVAESLGYSPEPEWATLPAEANS